MTSRDFLLFALVVVLINLLLSAIVIVFQLEGESSIGTGGRHQSVLLVAITRYAQGE